MTVKNESDFAAATPVTLYIRDQEASTRVPHFSLCGFARVELAAGESRTVEFEVTPRSMALTAEDGSYVIEPGAFTLYAGSVAPDERSRELSGETVLRAGFVVR